MINAFLDAVLTLLGYSVIAAILRPGWLDPSRNGTSAMLSEP
jgi:hypothetical protein